MVLTTEKFNDIIRQLEEVDMRDFGEVEDDSIHDNLSVVFAQLSLEELHDFKIMAKEYYKIT